MYILNEAIVILLNLKNHNTSHNTNDIDNDKGLNYARLLKFGYQNIKEILREAFIKHENTEGNGVILKIMQLCNDIDGVKTNDI